jgi:hypothetical protein
MLLYRTPIFDTITFPSLDNVPLSPAGTFQRQLRVNAVLRF